MMIISKNRSSDSNFLVHPVYILSRGNYNFLLSAELTL